MNLRQRRLARGLTVGELARRVGCQQPYISMLEHGRRRLDRVSYQLATAIARELDVEPDVLFGPRPQRRGRGKVA